MITGVWKGRINRQKVEVKIIQNGDNLAGTVYYYESPSNYRRYSIKGYFDPNTNEAVWWDDQLLEEKPGSISSPGKVPLLSRADFNCPGYGKMILGGKASRVENENEKAGDVNLDKTEWPDFTDEWDFVLENFTVGANDPDIIDSIALLSTAKKPDEEESIKSVPEEKAVASTPVERAVKEIQFPKEESKNIITSVEPIKPLSIEEKFVARKKIFATEIPVSGDSIELHFYDNAQIDGDSITVTVNNQVLVSNQKLGLKPISVEIKVSLENPEQEVTMVANNLGTIPPNTAMLIVKTGSKRYKLFLASNGKKNAQVRFIYEKNPE